jgi:hypothetical protein
MSLDLFKLISTYRSVSRIRKIMREIGKAALLVFSLIMAVLALTTGSSRD